MTRARNTRRHGRLALMAAAALGGAVVAGVALQQVAKADPRQSAPWCAYMGGGQASFDCSYYSYQQCMATARGLGNYCVRNPQAPAVDGIVRQRRPRGD